jgi:hypothetical protein
MKPNAADDIVVSNGSEAATIEAIGLMIAHNEVLSSLENRGDPLKKDTLPQKGMPTRDEITNPRLLLPIRPHVHKDKCTVGEFRFHTMTHDAKPTNRQSHTEGS